MYNYGYDTTNGQYNIDGQLIYVPSNNNNIYEYNNNYPNYTITNFVNTLPEPEIINNYQVNYQEQYANNNNSSPDYNLYNVNTNDNTPANNYYLNYNQNENQIYIPQTINQNNYPNEYALVTNINTGNNQHTNINPTYIQAKKIDIPKKNITNNINYNNLGINFKSPNYYLNNQIEPLNKNALRQNQIKQNYKNLNPNTQITSIPNKYKNIIGIQQQGNNINNNNNYIAQEQNRQIIPSEKKIIPIPNHIKKENIISNPNKNNNYNNMNENKMPFPHNNTGLNNLLKENNNITKGTNNNIAQIQKQNINDNKNKYREENINKEKQIFQQNTNNKNIVENKPKEIKNINTKSKENEKYIENQPSDNTKDKLIEEVTEGIKNVEIIPEKPVFRPLTQKDYDEIYFKGIGIINLGNTCFINSCLQALIHCKLFMQTFFKVSNKLNEETTPISYNFLLICIMMLDIGKTKGLRYIDISYFKYIFGKKHPIYNGYNQNDSQEFCRIFLEDLNEELNEAKNKKLYKALTNTANRTKSFRAREFDLNFKDREKSIIIDLFYSQIITSFKCKCGNEIYSFQKLLDFPLLLPENAKYIDIKDLFKNYFKTEMIDFETKCEKCNQIEKHKKEMKISHPPEILIISLQRINEATQKKNECIVNFPDVLNLFDFIDHDLGTKNDDSNYKLFSIINHQGNMNVGHYYTYVKPLNKQKWFVFNDSLVREINVPNNIFPYAYALFYIKNKYQ